MKVGSNARGIGQRQWTSEEWLQVVVPGVEKEEFHAPHARQVHSWKVQWCELLYKTIGEGIVG